jgi:hypothetical protein
LGVRREEKKHKVKIFLKDNWRRGMVGKEKKKRSGHLGTCQLLGTTGNKKIIRKEKREVLNGEISYFLVYFLQKQFFFQTVGFCGNSLIKNNIKSLKQ